MHPNKLVINRRSDMWSPNNRENINTVANGSSKSITPPEDRPACVLCCTQTEWIKKNCGRSVWGLFKVHSECSLILVKSWQILRACLGSYALAGKLLPCRLLNCVILWSFLCQYSVCSFSSARSFFVNSCLSSLYVSWVKPAMTLKWHWFSSSSLSSDPPFHFK